jgi:hypothetical protein
MVEAARDEASRILDNDETLTNQPLLSKEITQSSTDLHFE